MANNDDPKGDGSPKDDRAIILAINAIQYVLDNPRDAFLNFKFIRSIRKFFNLPAFDEMDEDFYELAYTFSQSGWACYLPALIQALEGKDEHGNVVIKDKDTRLKFFIELAWEIISNSRRYKFDFEKDSQNQAEQKEQGEKNGSCFLSQEQDRVNNLNTITLRIGNKKLKLDFKNSAHRRLLDEFYRIAGITDRQCEFDEKQIQKIVAALNDPDSPCATMIDNIINAADSGLPANFSLSGKKDIVKKFKKCLNHIADFHNIHYRVQNLGKRADSPFPENNETIFNGYWLDKNVAYTQIKKDRRKSIKRFLRNLLITLPVAINEGLVATMLATVSLPFLPLLLVIGFPAAIVNYVLLVGAIRDTLKELFSFIHVKDSRGRFVYENENGERYYKDPTDDKYYRYDYEEANNISPDDLTETDEVDDEWRPIYTLEGARYIFDPMQNKWFRLVDVVEENKEITDALTPRKVWGLLVDSKGREISLPKKFAIVFGFASSCGAAAGYGLLAFASNMKVWALIIGLLGATCSPVGLAIIAGVLSVVTTLALTMLFYCAYAGLVKNNVFSKIKNYFINIYNDITHSYWSKLTWQEQLIHICKSIFNAFSQIALVGVVIYLFTYLGPTNLGVFYSKSIDFFARLGPAIATNLSWFIAALGSSMNVIFEGIGIVYMVRTVFNIISNLLKGVVNFFLHPIESVKKFAENLKQFIKDFRAHPIHTLTNLLTGVVRFLLVLCVVSNTTGQMGAGDNPYAISDARVLPPPFSQSSTVIVVSNESAWGFTGSAGPNLLAVILATLFNFILSKIFKPVKDISSNLLASYKLEEQRSCNNQAAILNKLGGPRPTAPPYDQLGYDHHQPTAPPYDQHGHDHHQPTAPPYDHHQIPKFNLPSPTKAPSENSSDSSYTYYVPPTPG